MEGRGSSADAGYVDSSFHAGCGVFCLVVEDKIFKEELVAERVTSLHVALISYDPIH